MIPLFHPMVNDEARDAAMAALRDENFVMGPSVHKFEEEFARYIGTRYAVSVSSGTAALRLALVALGVGTGDTVVTPAFSFVATASAARMTGAGVRFVDSNERDPNLDGHALDARGARVVLPVHLYGAPCDMENVRAKAEQAEADIVEDACQAHGAAYRGRKIGSLGTVGCFSFYSTKNLTVAGDGGMVTTDREDVRDEIACLRDCGRAKGSRYEHIRVGDTLRLNTVNAAIGRVHLRRLDAGNERRRQIAAIYDAGLPQEIQLAKPAHGPSVYHLYAIAVEDRDAVQAALASRGVATGVHYPIPIHRQPAYKEHSAESYPQAEWLARHVLSLPIYPTMSDDEARRVVEAVREVMP